LFYQLIQFVFTYSLKVNDAVAPSAPVIAVRYYNGWFLRSWINLPSVIADSVAHNEIVTIGMWVLCINLLLHLCVNVTLLQPIYILQEW